MSDQTEQPLSVLTLAYGELQNLLLASPAIDEFLRELAVLAAAVISPAGSCGITLNRKHQQMSVVASDAFASQVDELQYGEGDGPCLQAMRTAKAVVVPDLAADDRWGGYRLHAIAYGVSASLSIPLGSQGPTFGAMNLYSRQRHAFTPAEITRVEAFAAQASGGALSLVLRQADQVALEGQLREALASRTIIDQALGIVMGERRCNARDAFAVLREASQNRNMRLQLVASEMIETMTGFPVQLSRPFAERRAD